MSFRKGEGELPQKEKNMSVRCATSQREIRGKPPGLNRLCALQGFHVRVAGFCPALSHKK
jgi:hypothetical protein